MSKQQTVLYKGLFYLVDDPSKFDPKKPGQGYSGAELKAAVESEAPVVEGVEGLDVDTRIEDIMKNGYQAEETNTNSPGTVAWFKAELDALDVKYDSNAKLDQLKQLFADNAVDQGDD